MAGKAVFLSCYFLPLDQLLTRTASQGMHCPCGSIISANLNSILISHILNSPRLSVQV